MEHMIYNIMILVLYLYYNIFGAVQVHCRIQCVNKRNFIIILYIYNTQIIYL